MCCSYFLFLFSLSAQLLIREQIASLHVLYPLCGKTQGASAPAGTPEDSSFLHSGLIEVEAILYKAHCVVFSPIHITAQLSQPLVLTVRGYLGFHFSLHLSIYKAHKDNVLK